MDKTIRLSGVLWSGQSSTLSDEELDELYHAGLGVKKSHFLILLKSPTLTSGR